MHAVYDALAALIDQAPAAERPQVLARLVMALAERLGDYERAFQAIDISSNAKR